MRRALPGGVLGLTALVPMVALAAANSQLAASAGTYYVTQIGEGALARVDVSSSGSVTVTSHYVQGLPTSGPDSAVFASDGTMLVSNFSDGTVSRVDVNSRKVVTLQLNKTTLTDIADLALDPNGNDVWGIVYSGTGPTAVDKIDLSSGATTPMNPDGVSGTGGITFNTDGSRLFVSSHDGYIAELDPHNGHLLRKVTVTGSPDGMTFDPATGYAFASGCGGICEFDTNGGKLALRTVFTKVDGDGIAADGNGHVYVAESSCGALCRLDLSTGTGVTVSDDVPSADDVTPLTGAGSAAGTSCRTLGSCFGGAAGAGIAAASVGLVVFMGAAGFHGGRVTPLPLSAVTHGAAAHGSVAYVSTGHEALSSTAGQPPPHATGPPQPPSTGEELTHLQEESGDKLLEAGGAGLEIGGARMARDAEERDAEESEAPQPPPLLSPGQPPEPPPLPPSGPPTE